ncbi:MAG: hypothetical protein M1569_01665 [Candidatus Marsarchaeota archaeon]|nr:hypothetical protein [Candidatus Marsarchaeota archaeon]MCL5413089.1 hypothetical protein [Candidatus Marsarchaeota archaeon]
MSLDAIKKSILSEAEAKASAIAGEANIESSRILKDAEERSKSIISNAEQAARSEADRLRKESEAGADTEAGAIVLEARGDAVEKALRRVISGLESGLSRSGMKKVLESGVRQFRQIGYAGEFRIRTSKRYAPILKDFKANVEYVDIDGFMIVSADGSVALNATVSSIVEREKDNARKLIAQAMFRPRAAASVASRPRQSAAKPRKKKR